MGSPATGGILKDAATDLTNALAGNAGLISLLNTPNASSGGNQAPKAYLHVLFFNEQFKFDEEASRVIPVAYIPGTKGSISRLASNAVQAKKNGYVYVYFSNESEELVFFDNFKLSHERGRILEETHYYAFGLTIAGISSKGFNPGEKNDCGCINKRGFNGNELQSKEFNDGNGLDFYDFNARIYDQQIGRFIQIDPLTEDGGQEMLSPFHFSGNNPSTFNDPDGKCPWCWGFVIGGAVEYGTQVFSNLMNGQSLNESITNVDLGAIMVSAVAGAATGGISAIVPKSTGSKVAIEVLKTTIDASESAVQQYNDNGSVSLTEIVVDVATQKVGGEISRDLSLHSPSSINATERKLDRAQRVAAGDPASSGRASTVDRLNKKLSNKINTNSAIQQGATGAAANAMQALLEVNIDLKPNMELINPIKDNTNVVKPIFKIQ